MRFERLDLESVAFRTVGSNEVYRGRCPNTLVASSGSMFVGRFLTDVTGVSATTSATINIEAVAGKIIGPVSATRGGVISLPDGKVVSSK